MWLSRFQVTQMLKKESRTLRFNTELVQPDCCTQTIGDGECDSWITLSNYYIVELCLSTDTVWYCQGEIYN